MIKVCVYCYEIYDNDSLVQDSMHKTEFGEVFCPKTSCHGYVIELDELIAPVIIVLNKKGYMTRFSCSGHWYKYSTPYIVFEDEEHLPDSLPKHFTLEGNNVIRYEFDNEQSVELKFNELLEINKSLLKWATLLDENN